jgi:hypothetical protein
MLNSKIVECELIDDDCGGGGESASEHSSMHTSMSSSSSSSSSSNREGGGGGGVLDKLRLEICHEESKNVRLTLQFSDIFNSCAKCERNNQQQQQLQSHKQQQQQLTASPDYELFLSKYNLIMSKSKETAASAATTAAAVSAEIETTKSNLLNTISSTNLISCVGCRASIERFYTKLLANNFHNCLHPIRIKSNGNLALNIAMFGGSEHLTLLYSLFYIKWYVF